MSAADAGLARRIVHAAVPLLVGTGLLVYAAWPWLPSKRGSHRPRTIVLYGFSILGEAMTKAVLPAFQHDWQQRTGEHIEVLTAFAGSGTITNQALLGVPADLCFLALELDALRLERGGLTHAASWRHLPHAGVVNATPIVILVRPGNPKHITDFADLARPGIQVVQPDPQSSGGANWALLAEYGSALRQHPEAPDAGYERLLGIWSNLVAQPASARAARTQFENGFGDALVTYEQEALADRQRKTPQFEIIYPASTILAEHTLVVLDRNVTPHERDLVTGLTDFLWSEPAQRLFVQYGFRSVDPRLDAGGDFGRIDDLFRIDTFGGWERAQHDVLDGVWKSRVLEQLEKR
jgi:sulfate transport system substrate-binding protein